jgi:dTDP-4-dehydrorhamnose 3,5-epimerase
MNTPKLIKGGIAVDDRGVVQYCNDFTFEGVKRFYTIENHQVNYVRAWHGHKTEAKYVTVVSGVAMVCAVGLEEFGRIDVPGFVPANANIHRFILSNITPAVLYIPGGYANGTMALIPDTVSIQFSTFTMEEAEGDDVRYPASYFRDIWEVKER